MPYARLISDNHIADPNQIVPEVLLTPKDTMQGDKVGDQYIIQYRTGNGFQQYIAMIDWEDWGDERCARLAIYRHDQTTDMWVYWNLCKDVCELGMELDWPDV